MLKIKIDSAALEKELNLTFRRVQEQTVKAIQDSATLAQQRSRTYLMAFIYDNPESEYYARTETALRSLGMSLTPATGGYLLQLRNDAPWAAQIELGNELSYFEQDTRDSHVPMISFEELALLMDSVAEFNNGEPDPTAVLDRRGPVEYQQPGAHITPAAVAAMYHFMRQLESIWQTQK